jgi:predicted nucleic acid-binding protein
VTFVDKPLVFDTPCIGHHARADRLDVLQTLLAGTECWITGIVLDELRIGAGQHPSIASALGLEWLTVAQQDTVDELTDFARWSRRLGNGTRNHGEASVFALAERLDAITIVDDREAVRTGRAYGLSVHGTVWLLATACRANKMTLVEAGNLIDALRAAEMRLPCTGAEFPRFAQQHGLL